MLRFFRTKDEEAKVKINSPGYLQDVRKNDYRFSQWHFQLRGYAISTDCNDNCARTLGENIVIY